MQSWCQLTHRSFVDYESGKTPSHFMVLNLRGQIYIIELPGGDAAHTRIFVGPQLLGSTADLIPATIHFVDSRHDHHPDMYLQAGSIQVIKMLLSRIDASLNKGCSSPAPWASKRSSEKTSRFWVVNYSEAARFLDSV